MLRAYAEYWLELPGAARLRVGGELRAPELPGLFRLRPEKQLGLLRLAKVDARGAEHPLGTFEVLSPRFASLAEQHRFVAALVQDLEQSLPGSAFATSSAVLLPAGPALEGVPARGALLRLLLARRSAELRVCLAELHGNPPPLRWRWRRERLPTALLPRLDGEVLRELLLEPSATLPERRRELPMVAPAVALRACVPSVDLREWLCAARALRSVLEAVGPGEFAPAEGLLRELRAFCERAPRERADSRGPGFLPRSAAVRRLVALCEELLRPVQAWLGSLGEALAVRDAAYLYERWAALELARSIGRALDVEPRWERDARGLGARFEGHGELRWQPALRSYTGPLRPDLAWERQGRPCALFDAKFRSAPEQEGAGVGLRGALREDLDKMHAYRDALAVGAALVLHPGARSAFFPRRRGAVAWAEAREEVDLRAVLEGRARGVGALATRPAELAARCATLPLAMRGRAERSRRVTPTAGSAR